MRSKNLNAQAGTVSVKGILTAPDGICYCPTRTALAKLRTVDGQITPGDQVPDLRS